MTNSYSTVPGALFRKFLFASAMLAMSVLYSVSSWGQVGSYNFSASAGTYTAITGGTLDFASWDDNITAAITIPSFTFNGVAFTSMKINSNGHIAFGTYTSTTNYACISGTTPTAGGIISAYGNDQNNNGTAEIRHEYLGGSNETVVQFQNARRFNIAGEFLNYQIRLNHTTNDIVVVYGTMTAGASATGAQVGIKSTGTTWGTLVNSVALVNIPAGTTYSWLDAVSGNANNSTMLLGSATPLITCPSGTTFTWTPQITVAPVTTYSAVASITTTGATIAWTAPTGATQYNVQYRAAGTAAWTTFSTGQAGTSAILTGLSSSTVYHVRVRARNATLNSRYSHIPTQAGGLGSNGFIAAGTFTTLTPPPVFTSSAPANNFCTSGGQTVVITGSNFSPTVTSVTFNGLNATGVVLNSPTQITCVTPVGITAGNLVVNTPSGSTIPQAYVTNTNPTVTVNSPTVCGAYPTALTAGGASTYSWSPSTNLSASTGNPVTLTVSGAGAITVIGTDAFGCTGSAVSTITYTTPPYVAISPTIGLFCGGGGTTTVSASSVNLDYTYAFSLLETGSLSNVTASSADFTIAQTAALRTMATDNIGFCAVRRDTSIGVYAFPTLTMTATPTTVCPGGTSVLGSGLAAGSFSAGSITHAPLTAPGSATTLSSAGVATPALTSGSLDDGGWGARPIGFTFNFFGTPYTTCNIGTNGTIMFGAYNGGGLGDFTFGALPSVSEPLGMIAPLAMDNNLSGATGGVLKHWTEGYAPNRKFVVSYENVQEFGDTKFSTSQMIIYETTGIVECHVTSSTNVDRNKVVGINSPNGLVGNLAFASGTVAAANNPIVTPFAFRFTPPSNYTTNWTPSGDISGTSSGTNIFSVTTNALSTVGANVFNLIATDQTSGCTNGPGGANVTVTVIATPPTVGPAEISAYGSTLGIGSATTSSPLVICGNQTVTGSCTTTLTGPEVVRWYDAATGGTLLFTGATLTTPVIPAGTSDTVFVEIYNGICSSASRTQFIVQNNTPPAVTINSLGPDQDINCGVGPTYTMGYQAVSGNDPNYTYTWTNVGAASFTDNGLGSASLTATATTNSTLAAFDAGTGCAVSIIKPLSVFALPAPTLTATPSTICVGGTSLLASGVTAGNFTPSTCLNAPPYAYRTPVTPTVLCTGGTAIVPTDACTFCPLDDAGWANRPIGFNFSFFGNTFSSVNVGTNGNVMFGTFNGTASGLGDFSFATLPSLTEPKDMIAICAVDLNATAGTIQHWTQGVAPNRIFVLDYAGIPGFASNGVYSMQLHLHETTGYFEVHVGGASGTGGKTIGVNNFDGTVGAIAPRCVSPVGLYNGNTNTIINRAWGFTPPVNYTFAWSPGADISGPLNLNSATALPTTGVAATVNYQLLITDNTSGCDNSASPANVNLTVVDLPLAPVVNGAGTFSNVASNDVINICGIQTTSLSVPSAAVGTTTAHYYSNAALTTQIFLANPYTATYTRPLFTGGADTVWVTLNNGTCQGPAKLVEIIKQTGPAISTSNSSPINCGTGPFVSNLSSSASPDYANYNWNASPALNTTVGANVTATVSQNRVFVVTGDDGYCYDTDTVSVSVYPFPTVSPTSSVDSICPGGTAILYSNVTSTNFSVVGSGYSPQSQVTPTFLCSAGNQDVPITAGFSLDDGGWLNIPIPFTFNFFGNNYDSCHISTNGNLQFGATGNFSTSFTPGAVPSATLPNNYVAATWADLNFNTTGTIRYWTSGVQPNRVFCVLWDGPFFNGLGSVTMQAELYETTGQVQVQVQGVTNSGTPNRVIGVENLAGTIGAAAPGRTGTAWQVTTPEAWKFNPPRNYSFQWLPSGDITGSNTLDTAVATPVQLSGIANYQLIVTDIATTCDNSVNNQTFVPIIVSTALPTASWIAAPTVGTSGGVTTQHQITNNSTNIAGATYAWTFSPATVTYVNGTTAASRNPRVTFNAPGLYSATMTITTCTGSNSQTRNNYFNITPQYCFPTWSTGCATDMVDNVVITTVLPVTTLMSHLGTGCNGTPSSWIAYAPIAGVTSCTLYQGTTYNINVTSAGLFPEYFGVWVDVNNNGSFADPGEFMGGNGVSSTNSTFSIGVPSENVIYGGHRMRVLADYSSAFAAGDFCRNGTWGEGHDYTVYIAPPVIANDIPVFATNVAYSSNQNYPNCYPINGTTAGASNSPESTTFTGNDVWMKFVAQSTGVSITLSSAAFDPAISLYSKVAGNYILVAGGNENASTGLGGIERLNLGNLVPGTTYYASLGSVNIANSGAFTVCIQQLMPSWCAFTIPVGGFGLCDAYKAIYRGASPAVDYDFNFTGVTGAPLVLTQKLATNGLTTLSQASLDLRWGATYNVTVDVNYHLYNAAPAPVLENVKVLGSVTAPNCTGVTIRTQPNVEVKLAQRCPAVLLRSNWLTYAAVPGNPNVCNAISYTYRYTQLDACGGSPVSAPDSATYSAWMPLGVLPVGANVGYWRIEIRPNFVYGIGGYGPARDITVTGSAASVMLPENQLQDNDEKSLEVSINANLYPNPNNGEMVNLNVSGVTSDNVFVRILDATGRVVYTNRFTVDGSLNTIVTFAQPLAGGLYNVEFTVDGQVMTERMIVTK